MGKVRGGPNCQFQKVRAMKIRIDNCNEVTNFIIGLGFVSLIIKALTAIFVGVAAFIAINSASIITVLFTIAFVMATPIAIMILIDADLHIKIQRAIIKMLHTLNVIDSQSLENVKAFTNGHECDECEGKHIEFTKEQREHAAKVIDFKRKAA